MTPEWLVGAPYVAGMLVVVHLMARLVNRIMEGTYRFEPGGTVILAHLMGAIMAGALFLVIVVLPGTIGEAILKVGR